MQEIETLTPGNYYHIYNRGIDGCNLFKESENYEYFLDKDDEYISPIAETFAWVLMPNHFHFLVRLNTEEEIAVASSTPDRAQNPVRGKPSPSQHFSNLFNSYAQAFNNRFDRHGSLFERPFKRNLIGNVEYLRNVILYIHNNPVHHGFCSHPMEYSWSSYLT